MPLIFIAFGITLLLFSRSKNNVPVFGTGVSSINMSRLEVATSFYKKFISENGLSHRYVIVVLDNSSYKVIDILTSAEWPLSGDNAKLFSEVTKGRWVALFDSSNNTVSTSDSPNVKII